MTAGNALQLGELTDHVGLQVVLGQLGRTPCLGRIHTDLRRNHFGQRGDAGDLVGHRAQLGLVGHRGQTGAHRHQTLLEVLVEEELGIGKARTDHPLIALGNFRHVLGFDIGNADELLGQLAVGIEHREELLVDLHGFDQRFLRHRQELALETAQHRRRPLDQVDHLAQVVLADPRHATGLGRCRCDRLDNARLAQRRVDQHLSTLHRLDVFTGHAQPHLLVVHEAVATAEAVRGQAQQLHRHDVLAMQYHQPVHRARECVLVRAPAHRLGDRHRGDGFGQDLRNQRGRGLARLGAAGNKTLALGIGGARKLGPLQPGLGGEAGQRLGRVAVGIQTDVQIRAEHFGMLFRLLCRHARQQHGQTTRGRQRLGITTLNGHTTLFQPGDDAIKESLRQARQRLDRQFFHAQFDQQRQHAHACTSLAATAWMRLASYSLATAIASVRTRRM